ncbi:MAG: T9SS type A sorting domain-containing protein [Tenuifilaceae bacterium]|jgi:photosystem II stability/assembly factor-like uncharacterized protein|nr:T9SS type A sorting domain-containing protein [Tenuifilaceae bacterium]
MRRFLLLFPLLFAAIAAFSQSWLEDFYAPNNAKSPSNFYQIQKDFNEYWSKYDIKGGYYYENGQKKKAGGWKQFKRWEWLWETRINLKTGEFPDVNIVEIQKSFLDKYSKSTPDLSNWQSMGPSNSAGGYAGVGRINCIAFHPTDPNTFWVGAPSGGLWKTDDGGASWTVLTDNLPVIGVSEIIIPNDYETSQTLYIATGDRDAGDNYSIGVLKSTDGGQTWNQTGLTFPVSSGNRITRLLVHPTQQNIFYAATNGGIFKSTNSGDTWTSVLSGLFFDMEFKHGSEDNTLFAVTANRSGNSLIYKTVDAGENWDVVHTFPKSAYRIELDVSRSNPEYVYALSSGTDYGLEGIYRSNNGGSSFEKVYDPSGDGKNLLNWYINSTEAGGQGFYDLTLSVSPTSEFILYLGGINTWKSNTGGLTWNCVNFWTSYSGYNTVGAPVVHADKHYMTYQNDNTFFEANDGGIYKTTDGGSTWTDLTNGLVISQMYKLGASQTVKDEVITGLQDNGSKLTASGNWYDVKGGDGMECIIDYTDVKVQYATYVNGQIDRTLNRWTNRVDISANIPGGPKGAWVTPYMLDPNDNQTLYVGYEDVWKSINRGDSWIKISNLGLSNKIRSMAIASSNSKTLYITDLNKFYRTTNGGTNWTDLTAKVPTTGNAITYISVDDKDPQRVWITLGGYGGSKALESTDGGETWNDISAGLPPVPANTIIQNKLSKTQQLYAGTDIGVFFREGNGEWTLFSNNLPSVIVTELEIHYDKQQATNSVLYASTYGRGLWKSNLSDFMLPEIQIEKIYDKFYVSNDSTASINISYLLNETFTGNSFTAYLSDASGNFDASVAIGVVESDASGTIVAKIPTGTPSGENYRVKISSSSPEFESPASNPFEVVLDLVSPGVTVSSSVGTNTSLESFDVKVKFSKDVNQFSQEDVTLTNATLNTFVQNSQAEYTVSISPQESGSVGLSVAANVAYDMLGNWNVASNQWSVTYTPTSAELMSVLGVIIFPNPTKGQLTIDIKRPFQNGTVCVYTLVGSQVFQQYLTPNQRHNVDLTHLTKGVYLLKLSIDQTDLTQRVVIE